MSGKHTPTLTDVGVDSERIDKDTSQRFFTISATVGEFDCVLLDTLNCHHCLTEEEQQSVAEEFARRYKAHDTLVIDCNTLRAANEGLRDSYLEQVLVNKALVAAVTECLDAFVQWDILPADRCRSLRTMLRAALKVQP